jgi:hypothetical protein
MTKEFHFDGIIKNVSYAPQLNDDLMIFEYSDFHVNTVPSQGIIQLPHEQLSYSIWDSPSQFKSNPFARIYKTFHTANRRITIVPVLKDDGADGKLEYIQYSTLSWMNLANVYIVFAYFDKADRFEKGGQQKLVKQKLNNEIIKSQIERLIPYHSSAIHWNRGQFGDHFKTIYKKAVRAYDKISESTKIDMHPRDVKSDYINKMRMDCRKYEGISIDGLKSADIEKDRNLHENKYDEFPKSVFYLVDGYGGIYYLTAKAVWRSRDTYVIQETRFTRRGFLPALHHIQDGLFRLVFFGNIDALYRNGHQVKFQPRLSLLGSTVNGTLYLPCNDREFNAFVRKNSNAISNNDLETLHKLRFEVEKNQRFVVEITQKSSNLV